ncbi:hypothetical protein ACF0H5_016260 [Mactra antiquata]
MSNSSRMEKGYKSIPMPLQGLEDLTTWLHLNNTTPSETSVNSIEYLGVTIKLQVEHDYTLDKDMDDSESDNELSTTVLHRADSDRLCSIFPEEQQNAMGTTNSEVMSPSQNQDNDKLCKSSKCSDREPFSAVNGKTNIKSNDKSILAKKNGHVFSKSFLNLRRKLECEEIVSDTNVDKSKYRGKWKSWSAGALLTFFKKKDFDVCSETDTESIVEQTRTSDTHSPNMNKLGNNNRVDDLVEQVSVCINCNQLKSECKICKPDMTKSEAIEKSKSCSPLQDDSLNKRKDKSLIFHPLEKLISHRSNVKHKKKCTFSFALFVCGCSRRRSFQ